MLSTSKSSKPSFDHEDSYRHYIKCQVLEEMREFLCKRLEPDRYFPYLRSQRILDAEMCEDVVAQTKKSNRVSKFLDYLIDQGGLKGFDFFVEALKRKNTEGEWDIIRVLMDGLQKMYLNPPAILVNQQGTTADVTYERQSSDEASQVSPGEPGGPTVPSINGS
ncbi:B-cell lymphoma/leukemia 10-like [Glandiceps talaboti]